MPKLQAVTTKSQNNHILVFAQTSLSHSGCQIHHQPTLVSNPAFIFTQHTVTFLAENILTYELMTDSQEFACSIQNSLQHYLQLTQNNHARLRTPSFSHLVDLLHLRSSFLLGSSPERTLIFCATTVSFPSEPVNKKQIGDS